MSVFGKSSNDRKYAIRKAAQHLRLQQKVVQRVFTLDEKVCLSFRLAFLTARKCRPQTEGETILAELRDCNSGSLGREQAPDPNILGQSKKSLGSPVLEIFTNVFAHE